MKNTDEIATEIAIVNKETVENMIYIVRGQKIMLDMEDAGRKTTTITEIQDKTVYQPLIHGLLQNPILTIT